MRHRTLSDLRSRPMNLSPSISVVATATTVDELGRSGESQRAGICSGTAKQAEVQWMWYKRTHACFVVGSAIDPNPCCSAGRLGKTLHHWP